MPKTEVISKIWDRIFEQAADEWNEAPVKDGVKYDNTLKQLSHTKQIVMKRLDPAYVVQPAECAKTAALKTKGNSR